MGCHTWWARPLTENDIEIARVFAQEKVKKLLGDSKEASKYGVANLPVIKEVANWIDDDDPRWWKYGWGFGKDNPNFRHFIPIPGTEDGGYYIGVCPSRNEGNKWYIDVLGYPDILRIENYPKKLIHNKKELRRYFGKRYFSITSNEHAVLQQFWSEYPDGIMYWG